MATIPLTITIKDYVYRANITVPTGTPSYTPPSLPTFTPSPITPTELRLVKILPENERRLPDANSGETIKITATVICKTNEIISKPRDTAYLIVDGAIADRKTIENGIVTFDWEATAVPISIHNICVKVDPSSNCKSPGQDCKRITVSPSVLGIKEQLERERSASSEQKRLLEDARSRLRSGIIEAELEVPGMPYTPPITIPDMSTIPSSPINIPTTPPTNIPILNYGNITIVGLSSPLNIIDAGLPIYLYIDDKNVGRIYELPKTVTNISTGTHIVYARGGDITTPAKTANVTKDETTTITL